MNYIMEEKKNTEIKSLNNGENENNTIYHLLDSRISEFMDEFDKDPNYVIPDWSRFILLSGTAEEICDNANNGEYGELCVVADSKGKIMWEWNEESGWRKPRNN